jgi:hypothetical protein
VFSLQQRFLGDLCYGLNVFLVLIASWSAGLKAPPLRLGMKRTHRDYPVKRQGLISQARDDISSSDGKR